MRTPAPPEGIEARFSIVTGHRPGPGLAARPGRRPGPVRFSVSLQSTPASAGRGAGPSSSRTTSPPGRQQRQEGIDSGREVRAGSVAF